MKIKSSLHDKLAVNKTEAIFLENDKYYPQIFLDECLNKL